jgi:hypothetical protein
MILSPQYKNFKLLIQAERSNGFFSNTPAKSWGFRNYFSSTHNDLNKYKKYNMIFNDYIIDLDWILQLENIPDEIREYASFLKSQKNVNNLKYFYLKSNYS